jgi:ribonuclease Z
MDLSLFFAGTAGSVPTPRRGLPAILLRRGGERILFDCGEGTQRQLAASVGLADLDEIFLTHFHADHWLGLPGLLKTFDLRGRERPLAIHGPAGLRQLLAFALRAFGRVRFGLELVELSAGDALERPGYTIAAVEVAHRGPSLAYAVFEDERPGAFDPDAARRLGVAPGPAFGRLQKGETVDGVRPEQVMGPPRPGRKVVLSGDTMPCESLRIAAHAADVLVHEATFAEEERERATQTGHSTAGQAATLAREAEVAMLALHHFSTRYPVGLLRDEARAIFEPTVVARDFDTIEVPFAERGRPSVVSWDERRSANHETAAVADGDASKETPAEAAPAAGRDPTGAARREETSERPPDRGVAAGAAVPRG